MGNPGTFHPRLSTPIPAKLAFSGTGRVYPSPKCRAEQQKISQACLPDARDLDEALAIYHSFPGFEEKAAAHSVDLLVVKETNEIMK